MQRIGEINKCKVYVELLLITLLVESKIAEMKVYHGPSVVLHLFNTNSALCPILNYFL